MSVMTIILMKEHVVLREKKEIEDVVRVDLFRWTIIIIILLYDVANRHAPLSSIRVSHVEEPI